MTADGAVRDFDHPMTYEDEPIDTNDAGQEHAGERGLLL
jgi:hypothetical protein